ncbi:putative transcriptional regulator [Rivularia sp. PCC 7116]|uniref:MerR family transcriptional regulator n=1 Tax=Rivularia sp. PCC 7116 TaxID=373994 RepID=UPI00029F0238|nr:MerR family transcriptional regulator [Rivularia sp. PCC 7116]AFY55679.1 putative transcriptional regulator [Rivularia sp. PCC 7116]
MQTSWKVGELASLTGLTVRTLHHYDEINLLKPSEYSSSGHRLYREEDIMRLQQILSLRQLGFSLEEIKNCLHNPDFSTVKVIQSHINQLNQHIELQQQLARLLKGISVHLQAEEKVDIDDLIKTIEVTKMSEELFNQYYTKEQRQYLEDRAQMLGEEKIQQGQQDWQDLFAAVEAEMNKGTEPTDAKVIALAKRWQELVDSFTGGNPGVMQGLNNMVQAEYPTMQQQFGFPDARLFEYIAQAQAAIGEMRLR